jgi:tRNA A37 threonylcarbamoyladenosine dehydratase
VQVDDLGLVTHDPLLASLRQRLRKQHGAARSGKIGVSCVFSRETMTSPTEVCEIDGGISALVSDGSLNCHGYGSSVGVTATFGMVAASLALESVAARK